MSLTISIVIVASVILLGILFMLIEFFLLPGISIAGVAGGLFLLGGIIYAYLYLGNMGGNITLATSAIAFGISFFWLLKSKSFRKIALNTEINESVDNSDLHKIHVGDSGITLSRLNPIGKIMVNNMVVEGKNADGEWIEEDTEIEIVKIESYNVLVTRKENK